MIALGLSISLATCLRNAPTQAPAGVESSGSPRSATPDASGVDAGQAQRAHGAALWAFDCAACHGAEGEAGRGGARRVTAAKLPAEPVPVSRARLARLANAQEAFDFVRRHMPADMMGELPESEYWDVVAFVLSRHGVTLGARALDSASAPSLRIGREADAGGD